ncbi:MAG: cysteine hydrolase [Chitinispirillaceae bacterium]|nr:cysteine hydrolase [Chitinispirillaceae bacterium]
MRIPGVSGQTLITFYIFFSGRYLGKSGTIGDKIDLRNNPNRAMIIVDLYNYMTRTDAGLLNFPCNQKRADDAIAYNNIAIDFLRKEQTSIIFIYQAFERRTFESLFAPFIPIKGSFKVSINAKLHNNKDPEFNKPVGDAFSNPELQSYLSDKKVGTLYITGAATEGCVYMTVWGARNRGYNVYVIDKSDVWLCSREKE